MNIKAALTRKLGPLPAWGWGGILAAVVLVYRHLHPGSSTSPDTTGSATGLTSTGNPAITGTFPSGGGGGADFTPTDQSLGSGGGAGTPVVFDPTTDGYPDTTVPGTDPFGNPLPGPDEFIPYTGPRPTTASTSPPAPAKTKKKKPAAPPIKTRGQTSGGTRTRKQTKPAPELVSEHGAGMSKAPAPSRGQTSQPTAVTRPRTTAVTHANTGARTTAPELVSEHGSAAPKPAPKPAPPPPPKPKPPPPPPPKPKPLPYLGRH